MLLPWEGHIREGSGAVEVRGEAEFPMQAHCCTGHQWDCHLLPDAAPQESPTGTSSCCRMPALATEVSSGSWAESCASQQPMGGRRRWSLTSHPYSAIRQGHLYSWLLNTALRCHHQIQGPHLVVGVSSKCRKMGGTKRPENLVSGPNGGKGTH